MALPLAAQAAPRYSVNVVGVAGSTAVDINNYGQVIGNVLDSSGNPHAFVYSSGSLTNLGGFGGGITSAYAINDSGVIVGYANNSAGFDRAFRYAGGSMADLGTLGGDRSAAYGINAAGRIVGGASTGTEGDDVLFHAFVYSGGVMTSIGTLPNGDSSSAHAINKAGVITGTSAISTDDPPEHPYHAFIDHDGVFTDLGTLGGLYSSGEAINDNGWVAGQASTAVDYGIGHFVPHGYVYHDGAMVDLASFGNMFSASDAQDVNNLNQVVGWAESLTDVRAFLFQAGTLTDLNALIDPASGWTLQDAHAINDKQQIAATGCRAGECYALRLDLISAVPEPGTWALLLTGLALLGWTRLRQARTQRARHGLQDAVGLASGPAAVCGTNAMVPSVL